MKRFFAALTLLLLLPGLASGQQPVVTSPAPSSTAGGNLSSTITGTGVFQQVFAGAASPGSGGNRHGCTILNNATTRVMNVTEGLSIAASTTALSVTLPAGGVYYCSVGGAVLIGQVNITGTAGDSFYAAQY